jgi:glycosyltransferase involved in cell wall biosynthesis
MDIHIFLLCYNESILLPHTIKHYKKYLPSCKITIYDNESTDNSVEIAKSLGCSVVSWNSGDKIDDFKYINIKNNCWKDITKGWIIMADMDEFLCVTEDELLEEINNGTSVLEVDGKDMIGESSTLDLSDIDLQTIQKWYENINVVTKKSNESKNLCFLREKIDEMNYTLGAHTCKPVGDVVFSSKKYLNKHMSLLGLNFFINKMIQRHSRSHDMQKVNLATHYRDDVEYNTTIFKDCLSRSKLLD